METLALDIYGTLIDPHAVTSRLRGLLGDTANVFSQTWRTKQLEFSFRRGLMGDYANFSVVTRDALEYTDAILGAGLSASAKEQLLGDYTRLDAYDDVRPALLALRDSGRRLFAFSNGYPPDLETLLEHAGLLELLHGIVSVDAVESFKPDPRVYAHFCQTAGTTPPETRLVSSNGFDVSGALACDWHATWVRRDPGMTFDGWGAEPESIVRTLEELADLPG
jgi:2-haloacid dehalogenase